MYTPSLKEFLKLSKKGNVIPVYKEINADLDTPVSAFLKIKKGDYGFLLESVELQTKIARYSFLGAEPSLVFAAKAKRIRISDTRKGTTREFISSGDPLDELKKLMRGFRPVELKGLPRFFGGMVGYLGYDTVRFFERLPDKNPDELKFEDALFILADTILIFDHINHTIKIVSCAILPSGSRISSRASLRHYQQAVSRIETIHTSLKRPLQEAGLPQRPLRPLSVTSNFKKEEFCAIVGRAKKYIRAGDIIQVVLSQRLKVRLRRQPFDIYRRLRSLNPSPYMFFLQLKGLFLVGSSPEVHLRCENRRALIRPIAGTRPRGRTPEEDERLARELLRDGKEKAEHLMLVDLARNDLGRTCEKGGVTVSEFMGIERYSHVMHLVSEVTGVLRKGQDSYDCLRQSFPAGTVSGSPKVRAMEIIDELENTRRSAYAGCVGYFSFSGNTDTCIAIRTIVIKGNYGYIQAGAGIVADSRQQREYQETLNKARALLEAV